MAWPGTPYFSNSRVAVYCGDAVEVCKLWSRRSFDLLCTDPPYGVDFKSGFNSHKPIQNDSDKDQVISLIKQVIQPLGESSHCYLFGFSAEDFTNHILFGSTSELIWDKGSIGMGDLTSVWGPAHEKILFGTYEPSPSRKGKGNLSAKIRKGSVLSVNRKNSLQNNRHPTEKPVALLQQLIESSSSRDDLVYDPFAGVGSTGVASILLGRRCVCVEIEEKYCEIAAKRCSEATEIADYCETL